MGSAVSLPIGLPSGTDPDSGNVKVVPAVTVGSNPTQAKWTVPGGEVWLVQTAIAKVTSVAPGSSREFVQILDGDRQAVWQTSPATTITAPQIYFVSFAVGMPETDTSGLPQPVVAIGLPWIVLQPTWQLLIETDFSGGGSSSFAPAGPQTGPIATVTFWDWGSGGETGPTALGPWMLVASPIADATVAA